MPTITDNAVCIRHWDFSESSQTVSLFGRDHGVIRGLAKGAKREKGSFSGGIDLLTRGEIVAIVKPPRELATLTEWDLQETFPPLRRRFDAYCAGLYMADLVHHMVTDHDPHPMLFDALLRGLRGLGTPEEVPPAVLRFQWSLLSETGYRPELHADAQTGRPLPPLDAESSSSLTFSPRAGGIVAEGRGADRWRVRGETVALLRAVAAGDDVGDASDAVTERANRLLAAYIRELLAVEPGSMRWMFPDLKT